MNLSCQNASILKFFSLYNQTYRKPAFRSKSESPENILEPAFNNQVGVSETFTPDTNEISEIDNSLTVVGQTGISRPHNRHYGFRKEQTKSLDDADDKNLS